MHLSKIIKLPDGRCLSFAEYGHANGIPVLFCHGAPGSRWQVNPTMAAMAVIKNMRIIVPERPGYGRSTIQPDRTLIDWTQDASMLMNKLGIEQFNVAGYSLGSIYALACGYALPSRVRTITLVGSLAPNIFQPDVSEKMVLAVKQILELARDDPQAFEQFISSFTDSPEKLLQAFSESLPKPDKDVLDNQEIKKGFLRDCQESLRNKGIGMVQDFVLATNEWGIEIKDIPRQVHIFHGMEDINAPIGMATYFANQLPNSSLESLAGEGHLSLFRHWDDILDCIATSNSNI